MPEGESVPLTLAELTAHLGDGYTMSRSGEGRMTLVVRIGEPERPVDRVVGADVRHLTWDCFGYTAVHLAVLDALARRRGDPRASSIGESATMLYDGLRCIAERRGDDRWVLIQRCLRHAGRRS